MHRWIAWAIPWLLAAALPVVLTQGSTAQEDNLLVNGGFEDGTVGWSVIGGGLEVDDALVHGGSYAGRFVTDATSPRREVTQCLPVVPATNYEFAGYAARRDPDPVSSLRLRVQWWDQDSCQGQKLRIDESPMAVLDPEERWFELAASGRSPSTARSAYLTVVVEESGATVYLDDFSVSGPAVPTQTPTPEPSAYPSPSPTRTASPHSTPTPAATAQHRTPTPTATPGVSPTASSWQWTPVPAQDALRNGCFEEADSEGLPSFWRKYGGELARSSGARFEGQFAAVLKSETTSTKWVYQIVTVQGGKAYVLSGYALKNDPAMAEAYLRISWYASPDGSGRAIDIADSTERLADDSPEFRFLTTGAVVAPAEAMSAKARLMLDPFSEAPGAVYFDAVTFEETALPEPTPSATATPPPDDGEGTFAPQLPAAGESGPALASEPHDVSTPTGSSTKARSSPTAAGNLVRAALAATRVPSGATTTAPTSTRVPVAVYRQRKSDLVVGGGAAARDESGEGGLSPLLLALAVGVPALAGAGAGAYCWRWRRARLR